MSRESRLTAGILLILLPAVVYGGTSILSLLIGDPGYAQNELRQDLWRAGHAHAGVLLVLSPDATEPNAMIYLAFVGAVSLASGVLVLGIGLVRRPENRTKEVR